MPGGLTAPFEPSTVDLPPATFGCDSRRLLTVVHSDALLFAEGMPEKVSAMCHEKPMLALMPTAACRDEIYDRHASLRWKVAVFRYYRK